MAKGKLRKRLKKVKDSKAKLAETSEPKIKEIKVYPKQKCAVEGCRNNAVGKYDVCKKHGGNPVIEENLMLVEDMPSSMVVSTKYKPEVHPMAFITMSKEGMSEVEIAAEFEVSVGTLRKWSEKFLDFNTAYEVGQAMHEAWWLQEGKNNLDNRGYNTGLFKFLTGNKLGYSDKMESKNLTVTAGVLLVPGQVKEEDWEDAVAEEA